MRKFFDKIAKHKIIRRGIFLLLEWGYSSVGRAPALQAGGQRFDSARLHHLDCTLKTSQKNKKTRRLMRPSGTSEIAKCKKELTSKTNKRLGTFLFLGAEKSSY